MRIRQAARMPSRRHPFLRRQQGQALVLCVCFAGAAGLLCLLLFNSGMLATTKTQLQNAADAGAYSAAVMLARDHNFSAYTNRAMVANQVAVAQMVSVKSYLEDAAATQQRMRGAAHEQQANMVPTAKPFWTYGKQVPIALANSAYQAMAPGAVRSVDSLIKALETGQELHHQLTAGSVLLLADEVVQANDPKARISAGTFMNTITAAGILNWRDQFTKRHRANDNSPQADRFADVVLHNDSTDQFMRQRGGSPVASWYSTPTAMACPLMRPIWTDYSFTHKGGTLLSADKRRWLALDATMGTGGVWCLAMVLDVPIPVYYSLDADTRQRGGSGGGVAGQGGAYGTTTGYRNNSAEARNYGGATTDSDTRVPARRRLSQGPGATLDPGGGLQDYYRDLADLSNVSCAKCSPEPIASPPLTIEVERLDADIRTSSQVLGDAPDTVKLPTAMKGNSMRVLSSGRTYFYRANKDANAFTKSGWTRADGRTETGSLFNPYWQAQLVDRSEAERLASIGAQ